MTTLSVQPLSQNLVQAAAYDAVEDLWERSELDRLKGELAGLREKNIGLGAELADANNKNSNLQSLLKNQETDYHNALAGYQTRITALEQKYKTEEAKRKKLHDLLSRIHTALTTGFWNKGKVENALEVLKEVEWN